MKNINLMVTCLLGLEGIVAKELKRLGYDNLNVKNGGIEFIADYDAVAKTNIWLRCADRVFWKLSEFKATDFDQLFENVKRINWADILPADANFPVSNVHSKNSKLFSKSDCQSIIKKSIVESLKRRYQEERFKETGALYSIRVEIIDDIVSVYIDTTGDALNKRGYRAVSGEAPIRETLAAAFVYLSRWRYENRVLLDPFCGTGTILIEAAMIAKNIAPGKNRSFVSENWQIIPEKVWKSNRDCLPELENTEAEFCIYGSDKNERVLEIARNNIVLAGVDDCIVLQKCDLKDVVSKGVNGVVLTNPPYGERLDEIKQVEVLYKEMGEVFRNKFENWSYFVITPHVLFEKFFGKKANKNRKLYNGGIKCYLYQYFGKLIK